VGVYPAKVTTEGFSTTQRLVVERQPTLGQSPNSRGGSLPSPSFLLCPWWEIPVWVIGSVVNVNAVPVRMEEMPGLARKCRMGPDRSEFRDQNVELRPGALSDRGR
jgi:hypothetical protein